MQLIQSGTNFRNLINVFIVFLCLKRAYYRHIRRLWEMKKSWNIGSPSKLRLPYPKKTGTTMGSSMQRSYSHMQICNLCDTTSTWVGTFKTIPTNDSPPPIGWANALTPTLWPKKKLSNIGPCDVHLHSLTVRPIASSLSSSIISAPTTRFLCTCSST